METESECSLLQEMFQKVLNDPKDEFAVSMFSTLIRNDSTLVQKGIHLILDKIKSNTLPQSLRSVELLEECMSKSGSEFQSEISKYRFLNELSKLVSRKYLGDKTLIEIKDKIMDCFLLWTAQYPEKDKIKSVYECLKKEGVQHTNNSSKSMDSYQRKSDFIDEENEKKLKKLLQSTSKEDVKKANLLIQYLVKQDEKKFERVLKQKAELKEIHDTVKVFDEVIDSFLVEKPNDRSLINDLYDSCKKYKRIVSRMPDIIEGSEENLMSETIRVNEELLKVLEKYNNMQSILSDIPGQGLDQKFETEGVSATIAFNSDVATDDLLMASIVSLDLSDQTEPKNPLEDLSEVFSPSANLECLTPNPVVNDKCNIIPTKDKVTDSDKKENFSSSFENLSKELFKSLNNSERAITYTKEKSTVSLNELFKTKQENVLELTTSKEEDNSMGIENEKTVETAKDILENSKASFQSKKSSESDEKQNSTDLPTKPIINYLSEIDINIDDIEQSDQEPKSLIDSKDGLKITLNFAKNKLFKHTSVAVVTSVNESQLVIDDFHFDAFVKKPCKLRLLKINGNYLPGKKPFRPPSESLQQIILIYNPTEKQIPVTFTLCYKQGEDPDLIKESLTTMIPYLN